MKSGAHRILQYYRNISSTKIIAAICENFVHEVKSFWGSVLGNILLISCCWFAVGVKHIVTSSKQSDVKDLKYTI